jgi:hypothetical protein
VRKIALLFGLLTTFAAAAVAQDPAAAVLDEPVAVSEEAVSEPAAPAEKAANGEGNAAAELEPAEEPVAETESATTTPAPPKSEEAPVEQEAAPKVEEAVAPDEVEAPAAPARTDWAGLFERAPKFLALTHHAAVHLPIALWIFGAFFVVVGVVVPSWRTQIPLACLIGGALTSVAAVASGWWYADYEYGEPWAWGDGFGDWSEHLVKHRWLGFALAVASIGLSLLALVSRARESRRLGVVWRLGLILLAVAVAWEGHLGGELIHGEGFLEEAFQEWVSPEPAEE